jgi:hypothetical protein
MFMILIQGVNFINILRASFLKESVFRSFYLQFGFVIFWHKNIGEKVVLKMLLKFAKGLLIIAFLLLQQVPHDGHVVAVRKKQDNSSVRFQNIGSEVSKPQNRMKNNLATLILL